MKIARKYAREDKQEVSVSVGYMRIYTMGADKVDKDWLELVEDEFSTAKSIKPDFPEPYFYMGVAYKMSFAFSQAAKRSSVLVFGSLHSCGYPAWLSTT